MSSRNFWLVVIVWCVVIGLLMTCSGRANRGGAGTAAVAGKGDPDVDLEAVLDAYKTHAQSGAQDLSAFEALVNARGWYTGTGHVTVRLKTDGAVIGFVDADGDGAWKPGTDKLVFMLEVDQPNKQIYASDRYHNRYRIGAGDILTFYLISRMLGGHRGFYGGYHRYGYGGFHSRGYYGRYRSTGGWGRRSYGTSGGRRTGGGRSYGGGWGRSSGGGWGGGK